MPSPKPFRINTCKTPVSVHSKGVAETLSPLESALTKKQGVGAGHGNSNFEPLS